MTQIGDDVLYAERLAEYPAKVITVWNDDNVDLLTDFGSRGVVPCLSVNRGEPGESPEGRSWRDVPPPPPPADAPATPPPDPIV